MPDNPNPMAESLRALRLALTDWVVKNAPPPDSRYPTLAAGQLVRPVHAAMGFPAIPGQPLPDNLINAMPDYDFGPRFQYVDLSGAIADQPPPIRQIIPLLVPKTDSDGNEVGGIPSVLHQAPLGTYLGWNITATGYLKGAGAGSPAGSSRSRGRERKGWRPATRGLRSKNGTVRTRPTYPRCARRPRRLVEQRFLLQEDADRLVREAEVSGVLR